MSLIPVVYPDIDAQGIETNPVITALFNQELELGSLEAYPVVLVKKESEYLNNQIENIPINFELKRIELTSLEESSSLDYGDGLAPGEEYRHQIVITPETPLAENSQYSVIIPKEVSLVTVFDAKAAVGNTSPRINVKGTYRGLIQEEYSLKITTSGSQSRCYYEWERLSDGYTEAGIRGRKTYLELEKGVFVSFNDGDYVSGDSFTIKVRPQQKIGTMITWGFTTGAHDFAVPTDSQSDSVVNLPAIGSETLIDNTSFGVEKITPDFADSRVPIGAYSMVAIGSIVIKTKEMTSSYNGKSITIIGGAVAGSETMTILDDIITIGIEEGVTLNQAVMDLINNSVLGEALEATSLLPNNPAILCIATPFSTGVERNKIVIQFNKEIDESTVNNQTISLFAEDLLEYTQRELTYSYLVSGKELIITIED